MKYYRKYLTAVMAALLITSCSEFEEIRPDAVLTGSGEMKVCIRVATPDDGNGPATRAQLAGETSQVQTLWMLCFDRYGTFVGKRQADITSQATTTLDKGVVRGEVPEVTARIHFVANYEPKVGLNEMTENENALMLDELMASAYDEPANTGCIYWGYVMKDTSAEMAEWIAGQGEGDDRTPENTVYLIRDRAKVKINAIATNAGIKSVEWCVSNGRTKGYIAAMDKSKMGTGQSPFENYYQLMAAAMQQTGHSHYDSESVINEYQLDDERFTAEESDLKAWDGTSEAGKEASAVYLYEDMNKTDNPVRLIIHVTYADDTEKYHAVLLIDNNQNQIEVKRNRVYWLTITALPKNMGVDSFEEALTTNNFTNNQLVGIAEEVSKVSNGRAELDVNNGNTSVLFTEPTGGGQVTIPFTFIDPVTKQGVLYDVIDFEGNVTSSGNHIAAEDFTIRWESNKDLSVMGSDDLAVSYDWDTGQGNITFNVSQITNQLASGVLLLKDKHYGMERKINVYSITHFDFAARPTLERTTTTRQVGNAAIQLYTCTTYRLNLSIPANYPPGLYPIKVEMASSTLNPYSDTQAGTPSGYYSVTIASTDMVNSSDNSTDWYYHAARGTSWSGWGFWYEYLLRQRPAEIAENDNVPLTLYLDDIRPTRLETTNISNVGMYLRIKYFKDGGTNEIYAIEG